MKNMMRLAKLITASALGGLLMACTPSPVPSDTTGDGADTLTLPDMTATADSIVVLQPDTVATAVRATSDSDFVVLADVVPDIIQEIRYYTTYNFIGRRIPGYDEPVALLTRRAADSLKAVSDELVAKGYRLKVFDAYRPRKAVRYFVEWSRHPADTLMKRYFYPEVNKANVFELGYVSPRSAHSLGATIDLTLFSMETEREVDMGGTYDFFGEVSHQSYTRTLTPEQLGHRRLLRDAMLRHGFRPVPSEWWHYTLRNEPYPDRSFDFDVRTDFRQ